MRDARRPPFCYQELAATRALRARFDGEERRTALAIYQSLTEEANDQRTRDGFPASRRRVADLAGCSTDTVDRYVARFVELGLLTVTRRQHEGLHLPNLWTLVSPDGGSRTDAASGGTGAATGSRTSAATGSRTDAAGGSRTGAAPFQEGGQEGEEAPQPPEGESPAFPASPEGNRKRDRDDYERAWRAWSARHFPGVIDTAVRGLASQLRTRHIEPTPEAIRAHAAAPQWRHYFHAEPDQEAA
jgi:hypothetical protein